MTKLDLLRRFLNSNKHLYSLFKKEYTKRGPIAIGPSDACAEGLLAFHPENPLLDENINTIVLLSHLTLYALNGQRKLERGNLAIVDNLYDVERAADIKLFYLSKPLLSLYTSKDPEIFDYDAFPFFSDNYRTARAVEFLVDFTHVFV